MSFQQMMGLALRFNQLSPEQQESISIRLREIIPMSQEECVKWMSSGSVMSDGGTLINNYESMIGCKMFIGIMEMHDKAEEQSKSWVPSARHEAYLSKFMTDPINYSSRGVEFNLFRDHCMSVYKNTAFCEAETDRVGMYQNLYRTKRIATFPIDARLEATPISRDVRLGKLPTPQVERQKLSAQEMRDLIDSGVAMPWSDPYYRKPDPVWTGGRNYYEEN